MRFLQPENIDEALETLSGDPYETKIIAGGTALVLMLQQKLIAPQTLVSLGRIPGLSSISSDGDGLHIGAMALLRDVADSDTVRKDYPALARACGIVGNVRVRNQATLGGNLAEADYASDPPAVLLALDARVTAASPQGRREIAVRDLMQGFYTTALDAGEIVESIHVPAPPPGAGMAYLKYKSRSSEDRPCVGVAAVASFDGDRCADLRVAVGAACELPRRLSEFEKMAQGQPLTGELIADIAEGYAAHIETLDDLRGSAWYRTQMIRVHVRRALEEVRDGRW